MITIRDLYNILSSRVADEAYKTLNRNNFSPQITDGMCASIYGQEKTGLFKRILNEYNELLLKQQRQQMYILQF